MHHCISPSWSARIAGRLLALSFLVLAFEAPAQDSIWSDIDSVHRASGARPAESPRLLRVNLDGLWQIVDTADLNSAGGFRLELPDPKGGFQSFDFVPSKVLSPNLQRKFPNLRFFNGRASRDATTAAQLELTRTRLTAQVQSSESRWLISAADKHQKDIVSVYFSGKGPYAPKQTQCLVEHTRDVLNKPSSVKSVNRSAMRQSRSLGAVDRTYRLAVAVTGEYGAYHGGTTESALAAVATTVNRVNGIFQRELSVQFQLIDDNDSLIYVDPETDPFSGNDDTEILIDESQSVIDDVVGSGAYDVGHTFSTGDGGLAQVGPCEDSDKARGVSGLSNPVGDSFDVDYVAHELGHQFGMDHTFNSLVCLENRVATAAFEPGAGTTIMGYAGACDTDDLQSNSDAIFHSFNFEQAANFIESGSGASCGTTQSSTNSAPSVSAGADFAVPARTPLVIQGSGSDGDADTLKYSWEQRDRGQAALLSAADDGAIPLFRVYDRGVSAKRYLPSLTSVVSGTSDNTEKIPRKARVMDFVLTARDERGGVSSDAMQIEVVGPPIVGPYFGLTEPNGGQVLGSEATVRWNVGGTNTSPISTSQIEMFLSIDGGESFTETPFAVVPNTGYARVTFPSGTNSSTARLMLKGRDNIFFDVSDADFTLNSSASPTPEVPAPSAVSLISRDSSAQISFTAPAVSQADRFDAQCTAKASKQNVSAAVSPGLAFNNDQSAVSTLSFSGDGLVSAAGLEVTVDISHTYIGDVGLTLTAPSGNTLTLRDGGGGSEDDIVGTFPTTLTALSSMSALAGESIAGDWTLTATDSFDVDDGVINSWGLAGEVLIPDRTILGSASPNLEITSDRTAVSSIELTSLGEVSPDELEVLIDVSHPYRGDLQIQVESPAGTSLTLKQTDTYDSADNVVGVFPDSLGPLTAFSALAGESLAGEWTLRISDAYSPDDGTLNSWAIRQRQFVFPGSASASPIVIEGLTNDRTYSCDITSVLSSSGSPRKGETVAVGAVSPSVSLELPSAPTITSTEYGDGKIILAVSVSNNGGTDITGYEAACTDGANTYTGTSTSSPITVSGLTNGVSYTCAVTAINSVGASAASASTAPITPSSELPRVVLEEPVMDETHTGVGNLRGWAISSDGIKKVEVHIDGSYAFDAPYGGVRKDVRDAFPDEEGSENSGFSLAFNYSNLPPGTHTVSAIAHSDAGATRASAADFEVVRFDSSFISDPNAVDLSLGSCSLASDEVTLTDVTVDGSQHDLIMKWRRAEQGFELIQIDKSGEETAEAASVVLRAQQSKLVAQSDPVLLVVLEEPVSEEIHTGVGNLRGWAVADEGIEKVEIYIDGAYAFDAPYGGVRTDVRDAFPDVEGSEDSGFSLAFNYSNLSAGGHTIKAIAYDRLGATKESSAEFTVIRFESSFISDLNAVDLSEGSCRLGTDEVSLTDVTVDGALHDLVMKWRRAEQGFEIIEIR